MPWTAQSPVERLAADELAVALAAADGATADEIAARLVLGRRTVEILLRDAVRTLGLAEPAELASLLHDDPGIRYAL
jgi:DNA-binding NarL/FixJ family response regulator